MHNLYEQVSHKSGDNLPLKIYRTSGVAIHWHEEYEFIMIKNGSTLCMINGNPVELDENTVILLQSGVLHSVQNRNKNTTAIVVSPSFWADDTVGELFGGKISFQSIFKHTDPIDLAVIEILKYIVKLYDEQSFGYEFLIKAKFTELFAILLQNGRFSHTPRLGKKLSAEFKSLINHVHEHYAEKISLDILSGISFYSKTYIIKLFKTYTDLTPSEYITQYRLSIAQRLLRSSNENNLDIALACGFNSESYFIHAFKKHYGITPHAYRSKLASSDHKKASNHNHL